MIWRWQKLTKQYAVDLDAACEPKKRWWGTSPTEDPANAKLFPGTWVAFREHIKEVIAGGRGFGLVAAVPSIPTA